MTQPKLFFTGLLVAALAGGWGYYWAQTRQAATLACLTRLDRRLLASNQQRAHAASASVFSIGVAVGKNRNQAADVAVLQQAQEIHKRTESLLDTLHHLRQSWQAAKRPPAPAQLPLQLQRYTLFLTRFLPAGPPSLAADDWGTAAPKPAALALLTRLATQVRQLEAAALLNQARKVGYGCDLCFTKLGAAAIPESETVSPGAVYQARLLLLTSTSTGRAQFSANGRAVPVAPATGWAPVQFTVPAAGPGQPDTVRAAWHGRVQLPGAAGDTVLEITVPYVIVKPPTADASL
jgi:hypothetical protein